MADVTIYKPANVTIEVIDGSPPLDQTELVSQLQAQVASLTSANESLSNQVVHLQGEIQQAKDNAAALVQGLND